MSKCVLICVADPAFTFAEGLGSKLSEAGYDVVCTTRPGEAPALLFLKHAHAAVVVYAPDDSSASELTHKLRCVRADVPVFEVSGDGIDLVTEAQDESLMPALLPTLQSMVVTLKAS